jgi:uncharacterized protein YcfL
MTRHRTRPRRRSRIYVLCLLAFSSLSCASQTVSNVAVGEVVQGEQGETLQKDYIIKDKSLAKLIQVMDVKSRFVGEFLEAQAIVRNRKKYTVQFEFKVEWYDAEGFPIESNITHWKPDLLYGAETKWISALCPKANAKGFKIMIREPNPVEK